ncbi:hypothetical protein WJ87_05825 [Burkholderia ubonensis]|nr:hypothetical protein WJ87_05825 [Burkholderia ubonensis]
MHGDMSRVLTATPIDQERIMSDRNEQVYGCDPKAMMADLMQHIALQGLSMVLISMLSDIQEMVALGQAETARKALNRLKYVVSEKLPKTYVTPDDVSVHAEVGQLRELYAQTTKGTWHALPGRALVISGEVSNSGYQGFDVLRGHAPQAREAKRNAEFSARMHNAAPALFDAAELIEHVLNSQDKLPREQRDVYIVDKVQATLSSLKQSLS